MEFLKGIQVKVHLDIVIIKMYVPVGRNIEEIKKKSQYKYKNTTEGNRFPLRCGGEEEQERKKKN